MMNGKFVRFFGHFYTKLILGTFLIIVGITTGIKLGYAFLDDKQIKSNSVISFQEDEPDERYPDVKVGDMFPLVSFSYLDGNKGNLEALLKNKRTLLIFANSNCEPCINQMEILKSKFIPEIGDQSQLILCYDTVESINSLSRINLDKTKIITLNFEYFYRNYNIFHKPTTFVIDEYGFIQSISVGFDEFLVDKTLAYFL